MLRFVVQWFRKLSLQFCARMDWVSRAINGREEGGEEGEGQEGQEGGGAKSNNIRKYQKS